MARKKKIMIPAVVVVVAIVLFIASYLVRGSRGGGGAGAADSAADSTADSTVAVADGDSAAGEEDKGKKKGKKGKEEEEIQYVPIEVSTVDQRRISSYYYTTATLDPEKDVDVLAKVAGQVTHILVEEGDVVKAGTLLCQIEDDEQRISLEEARINRDKQKAEYERLEAMYDQKVISDKEFSDIKYQYELSENQYQAAYLRYQHTKVRAPFGGVITKRQIDPGQNISIGTQLFEIVDPDPLLIRMYLPESEVSNISVGQVVYITPDNDPEVTLNGRVVRIAPEVDERTGTVKVTAETTGEAMPGSFARIKIVTDTREGSLAIPRRSLISDAGETYVYVAEADSVRRAPVKIGYQNTEYVEVLDGVEQDELVVVVGTGGLRTGTKVKILEPGGGAEEADEEKKGGDETAAN